MLGASDLLREDLALRRLLERYRQQRQDRRDDEWHDRVMELGELKRDHLCRLHGLLLAHGWLEVRVDRSAFDVPGQLRSCYRVTRDGLGALRAVEDVFDIAEQEDSST